MLPVGLPIGVISGLAMHSVLGDLVLGKPGVPWVQRSLPVLAGVLLASGLYFGLCYTPVEEYLWVKRIEPKSGNKVSYNPRTMKVEPGARLAYTAEEKRYVEISFSLFVISVIALVNYFNFYLSHPDWVSI
jgi:hypothetical protein